MADWNILQQQPNFVGAALQAYQAGRQIGRQRRTEAALQMFASDAEAGIGAALSGGDIELADNLRQFDDRRQSRDLRRQLIVGAQGQEQRGSSAPASGVLGENAAQPVAPVEAGSSAATGQVGQINQDAWQRYYAIDPAAAIEFRQNFDKLNEAGREAATAKLQAMAPFALHLRRIADPAQRAAAALEFADDLAAFGISREQLSPQNLTDQRLDGYILLGQTPGQALDSLQPKFVPVAPGGTVQVFQPDGRGGYQGMGGGAPAPSGPQVGTVVSGYRFNGGNPNDRASWVPVEGGAGSAGPQTFP